MGIGHAAGYGRWAAGPQGEGASVLRCEMFDDCLHLLRAVLRNDQYVVAVGHDDQVGYANDGDAPPFAGAKVIARRVDRDDVADADIAGFVLVAGIVQSRPAAAVPPPCITGPHDEVTAASPHATHT